MSKESYKVLFLCTGNSARSILAEALMNDMSKGRFKAYSAGSKPQDEVNRFALQFLQHQGHDVSGLRSKSWDEFGDATGIAFDFIFTVCDNAANETCPNWPGRPMTAHWGLPDPALATGSDSEIAVVFADTARMLKQRISILLNLPIASLDRLSLQSKLDEIGKS